VSSIFNPSNQIITTATIKMIIYSCFLVNTKYKKLVAWFASKYSNLMPFFILTFCFSFSLQVSFVAYLCQHTHWTWIMCIAGKRKLRCYILSILISYWKKTLLSGLHCFVPIHSVPPNTWLTPCATLPCNYVHTAGCKVK
jgi:hypothetical protein